MPQPDHVSIYDLARPVRTGQGHGRAYFATCEEKLGIVPNVLRTFSRNQDKLRAFAPPITTR